MNDAYMRDLIERRLTAPDQTREGGIQADIEGWHYWVFYQRNIEYGIYGKYMYDLEFLYFDRVRQDGVYARNPEDCDALRVPATWLEEVSGMLVMLLMNQVVAQSGDWYHKEYPNES